MPRRYRRYRSRRALKSVKYSNETHIDYDKIIWPAGTIQAHYGKFELVPTSTAQGMRKAKNFTLQFSCVPLNLFTSKNYAQYVSSMVIWALVYVPEGQENGDLKDSGSLYEPNQNVIMSGIDDISKSVTRRTRLARNLNSGDRIVFLYWVSPINDTQTAPEEIAFISTASLNYAITYN